VPRHPYLALACAAALAAGCPAETNPASHLARGNVLANQKKWEEALEAYRRAAEVAPGSALAREREGDVLWELGRREEALGAYRAAAAADPRAATPHIGAARALDAAGDLAGARAELTRALEQQPGNLFALLSRGNLLLKAGDRKAAVEDFEHALKLDGRNPGALYALGGALIPTDAVRAGEAFDAIERLDPGSPLAPYGRARLSAFRGDRPAALSALLETLRRKPDLEAQLFDAPELAPLPADPQFAALALAHADRLLRLPKP
jgi:tetratricopeptide (TPR) repeat protein